MLGEFRDLMTARAHIAQGGLAFAQQLLEQSLGPERAAEIIDRLNAAAVQMPFQFLHRADPAQLRSFIADEHPQVIALVLAHMTPDKASLLLSGLAVRPAGQGRPPHRGDGPHLAGHHPGRREHPGAQALLDAAAGRHVPRRRRRPAGQHHQPLRPLHRAPDRRGPRGARRRAGRRGPEPDVHVRGHRQPRRPLGAAGAARGRHRRASPSRSRASPRPCATRSPRTCPSAPPRT